MNGPSKAWLGDGRRLHLQHGPIDLIIEADGSPDEVRRAYDQACQRFETVLSELVQELPDLRRDYPPAGLCLNGSVARRMGAAVLPLAAFRITPMAAVAGAVADEILQAMTAARTLERAYVNNGGDIALMLGSTARFEIAMIVQPHHPQILGTISLKAGDGIGGIATSGRHGRSHSLGIASSVTVLAKNAALADAAATLIANEVDLPGHPAIQRMPAWDLSPDSDLGERPVTVAVGPLDRQEVAAALESGVTFAEQLLARGLINATALALDDQQCLVGHVPGWQVTDPPSATSRKKLATVSGR